MGLRICHIEHLFADFLGNSIFFSKYAENGLQGLLVLWSCDLWKIQYRIWQPMFEESTTFSSTYNKRNRHCHGDSLKFLTLAI